MISSLSSQGEVQPPSVHSLSYRRRFSSTRHYPNGPYEKIQADLRVAMESAAAYVIYSPGIHSISHRRCRSPAVTSIADRSPVVAIKRRDGSLPSRPGAKTYQVTVEDPKKGTVSTYTVPEDRYIWHSMTDAGADIPSSCRNGCCTTCAAKLSEGSVEQKEALGLLKEMRSKGYALLCVSYPRSDIHCVLQEEDEVYIKQFGTSFESGGVEWGGVLPEDD